MNKKYTDILDFVRPHYRKMEGYISAGMQEAKNDQKIFLNANENPFELPGLEGANRYPEPQPPKLLEAMAGLYGVEPDHITITRGADEGIALLFKLFCNPEADDILINPPTFGVYKVYAGGMPARNIISVPLLKSNGTFALDVDGIGAALDNPDSAVKLIFLTNPNNPTGTLFDQADILRIINLAAGRAIVVLDETYAEFAKGSSLTQKLAEFDHLIILRTLSKSFSLAGMRVGAILSGVPDITQALRTKAMEIYPIPVASVQAALRVFDPDIMVIAKNNIEILINERKRLEEFLGAQSCVTTIYPSRANFLLVEMKDAAAFCAYAHSKNIIIRDFSSAPDTKNCMRLSIGTPEQNDMVMALMREFEKI